jgi:hypothetical protein
LSNGTASEFLSSFQSTDISGVGKSLGNGLLYHWSVIEPIGFLHLHIDHSNTITNGLFVEIKFETDVDRINYEQMASLCRQKAEGALAQLGLEFEKE